MERIPDVDAMIQAALITRLLSFQSAQRLTEWDLRYQFDLQILQLESK